MSPILVRPVREQLEHDRVIRLLQAKYKRKFEVLINPGHETTTPVLVGTSPWNPDLVLFSLERGRKLMGTVEVETAESVNNLEAMSQWRAFAGLKPAFHLYIPVSSIDTTKRMVADLQLNVAELWAYSPMGDQMRFSLIQRSAAAESKARAAAAAAAAAETKARPVAVAKPVAKPVVKAAAKPAATRPAGNGRSRAAAPARPAAPRRTGAAAAKTARKAAPARPAAKSAAPRRPAAKKTAARAQKRK